MYPALDPVTVTLRALPRIAATGLYVLAVAPVMATPLARHWYRRVTGAGPQVRGTAVSIDPTFAVPLIVGTEADRTPAATLAVAAEVLVAIVYPAFVPVTVTVIVFPRYAAAGL